MPVMMDVHLIIERFITLRVRETSVNKPMSCNKIPVKMPSETIENYVSFEPE